MNTSFSERLALLHRLRKGEKKEVIIQTSIEARMEKIAAQTMIAQAEQTDKINRAYTHFSGLKERLAASSGSEIAIQQLHATEQALKNLEGEETSLTETLHKLQLTVLEKKQKLTDLHQKLQKARIALNGEQNPLQDFFASCGTRFCLVFNGKSSEIQAPTRGRK